MAHFKKVDPKKAVNEIEESVLAYWKENDIAAKSVAFRDGRPKFVFYEGPPTANGKPGIHHVFSRTIKDVICRYMTMLGYQVPRKAGWDTHGLPVEIEVERQLGLSSKQDIEEYGIEAFNKKCRESVFAYLKEWRSLTERIAYWVDMDNPYVTLDNDYIETVWWILKRFFDEGLIYEGHKVMPYCPRCGTPLASHEVAQGYRDEQVASIYVKLKLKGKKNEYLLVWTTTPWTLPSNVGVAVNPESVYAKVSHEGEVYYAAKERVPSLFGDDARVLGEISGKQMEFMEYEQLFSFVKPKSRAFFVTLADYVSTDDGTGLVHIAPAYGEDDYNVCRKYGLPLIHLVDERGKFVDDVTDWAGMFVKSADKGIVRKLNDEGKLFRKEQIIHSYPHCWRCDTPLLYYARKSWYIETTKFQDELIANNEKIRWFPAHVGSGRFGNWLENLVDWSLSRNRYWGTPLNIWKCEKCGHLEAIGSRKELAKRSIELIDVEKLDLHRPYVDDIHFSCSCGGKMSRTPEVIDCWFDSGSMPYAQWHYPFENEDEFEELFPADFISEGLDQTRGWFYSLLAIATLLSGKASYKQVLVNDLVLDKHGQKMSKSKGNSVDPWMLIDEYGADALRWYLLAVSPPWVPTRFDEQSVREAATRFFGTLINVYAFFTLYANIDGIDPTALKISVKERPEIDRWIISRMNTLIKQINDNMLEYELTKVVRSLESFLVDEVSNWYVRRSRDRFWSNDFDLAKKSAYLTLYEVLFTLAKLLAPFAPLAAEDIYLNLERGSAMESVHLEDYPQTNDALLDLSLEERMGLVIKLVSLGRSVRNKMQIKVRQPLNKMLVDGKYQSILFDMEGLVKEELNIKEIEYVDSLSDYVTYELRANLPVAGPKYGKDLRSIMGALGKLDARKAAKRLKSENTITLDLGQKVFHLGSQEVDIKMSAKEGFAVEVEGDTFLVLDTEITEDLALEGYAREIVSKVQNMRKNKGFDVLDHIILVISSNDTVLKAVKKHQDYVKGDTLCDSLELTRERVQGETWDINGHSAVIKIERI